MSRTVQAGARHWLLIVIVIGLLLYLPGLDLRPFYREEGRRAVQAIAILAGGSWWNLETAGLAYIAKPPLLPWLMALFAMVMGQLNEWAVRLPSVLAVIITAVTAGATARLLVDDKRKDFAALAAGLVLLSCPMVMTPARLGETDAVAMAGIALAFFVFVDARAHGRLGVASWLASSAALAAAVLAKGPGMIGFAVFPILVTVILDRSPRQIASAMAALALAFLPLGIWIYFNFAEKAVAIWASETRIASAKEMVRTDWLISLLHLNQVPAWLAASLPWSLFAVFYLWRTHGQKQIRPDLVRALLLYAIPFTLIVLLWPTSRVRYGLPAIVPLSILAGTAVAVFWDTWPSIRRIFITGFVLLAAFQLGRIALDDGRTAAQKQRRANAISLAAAIQLRPAGTILLVWEEEETLPYNLIAYAGRPMQKVKMAAAACRRDAETLLVTAKSDSAFSAPAGWKTVGPVGRTGLMLLDRDPRDRACGQPSR